MLVLDADMQITEPQPGLQPVAPTPPSVLFCKHKALDFILPREYGVALVPKHHAYLWMVHGKVNMSEHLER